MRDTTQVLPMRPTCLIGLGGRGCEVVCEAVEYLAGNPYAPEGSPERHGFFGSLPPFWVPLGIDAVRDPREHRRLSAGRFFHMDTSSLNEMIKRVRKALEPEIAEWLDSHVADPNLGGWGLAGRRQLGRLAYDLQRTDIRGWLERAYNSDLVVSDLDAKVQQWQTEIDVSPRYVVDTGQPADVILVGSACGGTGSSILLPLAADIRDVFGDINVTLILFLPESFRISEAHTKSGIEGNAYACVKEIDHFMREGNYEATFRGGEKIQQPGAPFDSVYLVSAKRSHDVLSPDLLLPMVAQFIVSVTCRPGGFGILARHVNYRDRLLSSVDDQGKRRCYSFLGASERSLKLEGVQSDLAQLIFDDVLDSLTAATAEAGRGASGYDATLERVLSDARVGGSKLNIPQSADIYALVNLPESPKANIAVNAVRNRAREVDEVNEEAFNRANRQARDFVQRALPEELKECVTDAICLQGVGAGIAALETALRLMQGLRDQHAKKSEEDGTRCDRVDSESADMMSLLAQARSPEEVRRLTSQVCQRLRDSKSAHLAQRHHSEVVLLLDAMLESMRQWHGALQRNAQQLQTMLGRRAKDKKCRQYASSHLVAVAFHEYLRDENTLLWEDALRLISPLLIEEWNQADLEQQMEAKCRAKLTRDDLKAGRILITRDGNPTPFLQAAIEDAAPCWNPDLKACADSRPVELMSLEVNGADLPDLQSLARALQVGRGRDVETPRQGFLAHPSFLILRADVGASVSYLPDIRDWHASYADMVAELRRSRRTGEHRGRQPHTEKRYESECDELVLIVREFSGEEMLAFGKGFLAGALKFEMGRLWFSRDESREPVGRNFQDGLVYCVRHNFIDYLHRLGDQFLEGLGSDPRRADALEQQAQSIAKAADEIIPKLPPAEHSLRLKVAEELRGFTTVLRQART